MQRMHESEGCLQSPSIWHHWQPDPKVQFGSAFEKHVVELEAAGTTHVSVDWS